ncbi:MAG: hypothetical protein GWN64_10755 [Candidatus Thorarchaeota archaeon]|nr:hypothetical protein [Candidatus Thorarchaeota archaeon]
MRKIPQGVFLTLLLTTSLWTAMPLTPAQEEKEQDRTYIKAIDGRILETPILVKRFVRQLNKAKGKPTRKNRKRPTDTLPNERGLPQRGDDKPCPVLHQSWEFPQHLLPSARGKAYPLLVQASLQYALDSHSERCRKKSREFKWK